ELVIMASATIHRDAEKCLGGVLDGRFQPSRAAELFPIANEKTRSTQSIRIGWRDFVTGQHLGRHAIVAFICVERFDDPIAPAPDMPGAVADLLAVTGPVAVAPDVHPVPRPTLAVLRAG